MMTSPTRTLRTHRDYARLERHRVAILCPKTWGTLLGDTAPAGDNIALGTAPMSLENCEL